MAKNREVNGIGYRLQTPKCRQLIREAKGITDLLMALDTDGMLLSTVC